MAGVFNRIPSQVGDRQIWNEDFVNVPNWLCMKFKIEDGDWFDINTWKINSYRKKINCKNGQLERELEVEDSQGRQTRIISKRTASMVKRNRAAMIYSVQPINYEGRITFRSGLNGKQKNTGVDRYNSLNQQHLEPVN